MNGQQHCILNFEFVACSTRAIEAELRSACTRPNEMTTAESCVFEAADSYPSAQFNIVRKTT